MTQSGKFFAGLWRRKVPAWSVLVILTLLSIVVLEFMHLPASPLLGGIVAGGLLSLRDTGLQVPTSMFLAGQSLIGCMIARSFSLPVLRGMLENWLLAVLIVVAVIFCSFVLGWVMTMKRILPGTTAIWGSSPGAAAPMTLMSGAYGADMRLVAIMQYLRVVVVSAAAAVVAGFLGAEPSVAQPSFLDKLFPSVAWGALLLTLAFTLGSAYLAHLTRIQAAPFLLPLFVCTAVQNSGIMTLELPGWLLAFAFALIGWSIGLRFNRAVFLYAWRVLPQILGAIFIMVGLSGGIAVLLVIFAGFDPLTAYLATSPGGVDAVAIIAASSGADMVFVMAIQTARLILVLMTGPALARFATRRLSGKIDNTTVL